MKTAYSVVCEDFLSNHPGRVITLHDLGCLFGKAYLKVATVSNAIAGFKATGIEPFDSQIFTDLDFEASKTTERDAINPTKTDSNISTEKEHLPSTLTAGNSNETHATPEKEAHLSKNIQFGLPALPQADASKPRRIRKKLPSLIISSTPVKDALEQKRNEKLEKEKKNQNRGEKLNKQKKSKKTVKINGNKNTKRLVKFDDSSSSSNSSSEIPYADTDDDMDLEHEEDDNICLICKESGKNNELWFRCFRCHFWAHSECAGLTAKEAKKKVWICDLCGY